MKKIKEVLWFTDFHNNCPIEIWLNKLDVSTQGRILERIYRLEYGAYGDYKIIGNKLFELRFFFGKGYRIYFTEENDKIVILLLGGNKDSQNTDIKKAKNLLEQYITKKENHDKI